MNKGIIIALFIFIALAGFYKNCNYDSWYHLKAGQVIVETKGFPANDPFYYTLDKEPFTRNYWLFQVVLYGVYVLGGFAGITLFHAFFLMLAAFLLYKLARLKTDSVLIIVPVMLSVIIEARGRFFPRPELFAMIFFLLFLYLINLFVIKKSNLIYFIPLIQILWANSHPSSLFGLVIILCYIAGIIIEKIFFKSAVVPKERLHNPVKTLLIILLLSVIGSCINPAFYETLSQPVTFFFSTKKELLVRAIEEMQGFDLKRDIFSYFAFLLIVSALTFLLRGKKLSFSELFMFIFFAYLALSAVRFVAFFMFIAGLVLFNNLEYIRISFLTGKIKFIHKFPQIKPVIAAMLIIYAGHCIIDFRAAPTSNFIFGAGISKAWFPVKLVDFIEANNIKGRMLNPLHYGGYLEWRLYPAQKVFIDGRILGSTDFRNVYFMLYYNEKDWMAVNNYYDFDYIIVEFPAKDTHDRLAAFLTNDRSYKIVYFDDQNILFVKQNMNLQSYRYISPFDESMARLAPQLYDDSNLRTEMKNELHKLLAFNPDISKVHHYLGNIYYMETNYDNALMEYKKALEIDPLISSVHRNIGSIYYNNGSYQAAIKEFTSELAMFPDSNATRLELARSYIKINDNKKAAAQCYKILEKEPANQDALELLNSIK